MLKVIKTKIFYKYVTKSTILIDIYFAVFLPTLSPTCSSKCLSHIDLFGGIRKPTASSKCNIINQFIPRSRNGDGRGYTLNTSSAVSLRLILTTHKLRSGSSILSSTSELVWLFSCKCSKSCRSNNRLYSACIFIQTNTTINLNLMHYKGMFWPDQLLVRPGTPACNHTLQLPVQHKLHKEKQSTNSTTTSDWPFYTWNCMIENDYPNSLSYF